MVAVDLCLLLFLCLSQSQVTPSHGLTLPFSSFSSQVVPRRSTNSSVSEIKSLPSVSTIEPNLKPTLGNTFRPPDYGLSSSISRGSLNSPSLAPTTIPGSNTQLYTNVLSSGVIGQPSVIESNPSKSIAPAKSYSVPNLPYLTDYGPISSNVIPFGIQEDNVPKSLKNTIPGVPLNTLGIPPNVASQINVAPNIASSNTVLPAMSTVNSNFNQKNLSESLDTTLSLPSFAKSECLFVNNAQSSLANTYAGTVQPTETELFQYLPSVLPVNKASSYTLPVVQNTNENDFSITPMLNLFDLLQQLPYTQQNYFDQISNNFEPYPYNFVPGNSSPLSNTTPFSPTPIQQNGDMLNPVELNNLVTKSGSVMPQNTMNTVLPTTNNNLSSLTQCSSSSSVRESETLRLDNSDKSNVSFKIKPKSVDLKILPIPLTSEKPLQGCVIPLMRNQNTTSNYSSLSKSPTLDRQSLHTGLPVSSLGTPTLRPSVSNIVSPPSCIGSDNPMFSQSRQMITNPYSLGNSASSTKPLSGVSNLPQNLLESSQKLTLLPKYYTCTTYSRGTPNLISVVSNHVLPMIYSESPPTVPCATESSIPFSSLITSSLVPGSINCFNNTSAAATTSIFPPVSNINDKINCLSHRFATSNKILPPKINKPATDQPSSELLPSLYTQSICNHYQGNELSHPTVHGPSSNKLEISVDCRYPSLNTPKILPFSQNSFLSNDPSFITPPQVPLITRPIFNQNHSIQTLTEKSFKDYKQPSIDESLFSLHSESSGNQDHIPINNIFSSSTLSSSTTTYKPLEDSLSHFPGPYAPPEIFSPVVIDSSLDKSPLVPMWLTLLAQKIEASKSNTLPSCPPNSITSSGCSFVSIPLPYYSKCQTLPSSICFLPANYDQSLFDDASGKSFISLPICADGCSVCTLPCSNVLPSKQSMETINSENKEFCVKFENSVIPLNGPSLNSYSSTNSKIPDLIHHPRSTEVLIPEDFKAPSSKTAFQSLMPDLCDFNVVPSSSMTTSPVLPPITCPDIFFPLDDIMSCLQKSFEDILPVLNTPERSQLTNDFIDDHITKICNTNTLCTPPVAISAVPTKSSIDCFLENFESFSADYLKTSFEPLLGVSNNNIECSDLLLGDDTIISFLSTKTKNPSLSYACQPEDDSVSCDYFIQNIPAVSPVTISKDNYLIFPEILKSSGVPLDVLSPQKTTSDLLYQVVDIPIPYCFPIGEQISRTSSSLLNNKNNYVNTIDPFSEVFIPVSALPAVPCDYLDSSTIFDMPTYYETTFGNPLSTTSLVSSLPEVILLPSCSLTSQIPTVSTSQGQNVFVDAFSSPIITSATSTDYLVPSIILGQPTCPILNSHTNSFSTMPAIFIDTLPTPSLPSQYDFGSVIFDDNGYVILEQVLLPGTDSFFSATPFDYQTNLFDTVYPSELFYPVTSLPAVSYDSFDGPVSFVDCSSIDDLMYTLPFNTYPEYLIPSAICRSDVPSACDTSVIEQLSPSDPSPFMSYDVSSTQSKSSLITNLVEKLTNTLITSALPNLATLCTEDK